jgi:hypothetical protein
MSLAQAGKPKDVPAMAKSRLGQVWPGTEAYHLVHIAYCFARLAITGILSWLKHRMTCPDGVGSSPLAKA